MRISRGNQYYFHSVVHQLDINYSIPYLKPTLPKHGSSKKAENIGIVFILKVDLKS